VTCCATMDALLVLERQPVIGSLLVMFNHVTRHYKAWQVSGCRIEVAVGGGGWCVSLLHIRFTASRALFQRHTHGHTHTHLRSTSLSQLSVVALHSSRFVWMVLDARWRWCVSFCMCIVCTTFTDTPRVHSQQSVTAHEEFVLQGPQLALSCHSRTHSLAHPLTCSAVMLRTADRFWNALRFDHLQENSGVFVTSTQLAQLTQSPSQ
jgi:hypothetical protein